MRKVIYTINFNNYEPVREPVIITPGWDYVMITDNDLKSKHWDIKKIESSYNSHITARNTFINSQKYFSDYDLIVMIGGQIQVNCNLDNFIEKYINLDYDINILNHCRNCVYKEADEIKKFMKNSVDMINLQMKRYRDDGMPEKFGLWASGIIVRKSGVS